MGQRVVIVGGGAIGSSIAYWLTLDPTADLDVTVIERDPTYHRASSALSCSSVRQQFSTSVNIEIGLFGIGFLRRLHEHLAVDGDSPELGLVEPGYLYLATEGGRHLMEDINALQRGHGANVALLNRTELARRYPWMSLDDVALGSLGLSGEGWFDGYGLLRAFRRKAQAQGARYVTAEVTGARLDGDRVTCVEMGDETLECDVVVNAAGPWAARVAAFLELDLPVRARRRSVFVLSCPDPLPDCPLLIDISGVWLRPEGTHFLTSMSPAEGEPDPDDLPLEPDHDLFEERVWPTLAARVPALERLRVTSAWAGYYEYNVFDQNGIVGRHPVLGNAYLANGFSGHGIQQSPAVGRGIAELIRHGRYTTLDLSPLAYDRIARNEPLLERNII